MNLRLKPSYQCVADRPLCRVLHAPSMTSAVPHKHGTERSLSSAQRATGGGLQDAIVEEPPVEEGEHLAHFTKIACTLLQGQATLVNLAVNCHMIQLHFVLAIFISVMTTSQGHIRDPELVL